MSLKNSLDFRNAIEALKDDFSTEGHLTEFEAKTITKLTLVFGAEDEQHMAEFAYATARDDAGKIVARFIMQQEDNFRCLVQFSDSDYQD